MREEPCLVGHVLGTLDGDRRIECLVGKLVPLPIAKYERGIWKSPTLCAAMPYCAGETVMPVTVAPRFASTCAVAP
jgi:hypothetical protein